MARILVLVFGIIGLTSQVSCSENESFNKYDNYTLLRIFPKNDVQLQAIHNFEDPEHKVEILKRSRGFNDSLDVLVPPERMDFVDLFSQSMSVNARISNYGRSFQAQDRTPKRRVMRVNLYEYKSYNGMINFIETVARDKKSLVKIETLGDSFEGRPLKLVKISSNHRAGNPIIFIDAGIHAREWVAPAFALYLIHRLAYDQGAKYTELNGVDWYIIPLVNPDGYEYSRSSPSSRLWRKTRSKTSKSDCYGVDANRNYGFKWAVSGVSNNPCDQETYAGSRPFSEPETKIIRNVMMEYQQRIKLYVTLHAYGQYLVYPWGYTGDYLPKGWKKLDKLARLVSAAVVRAGGPEFNVLSAGRWYPAAGGSDDYAFGAVGIPYAYTMELTVGYEFVYPEELLSHIFPQLYQGFKVFGSQIKTEFGDGLQKH